MSDRILVTRSSMPPLDEYVREIEGLWESHWLTNMGEKHQQLEEDLKRYLGVSNVALFVNGHTALECVLEAMQLGADGRRKVITTPFTFASTTHAIVRVGLEPVLADIDPVTYTLDPASVEALIDDETCAIVPVHVYGKLCDVDALASIAKRHNLKVVEDAAQAVMSSYKGQALGAIGDYGCYSFHETKNYSMGEGGALLIKDPAMIEKAEILREKGTNRSVFLRGQIDKYTWVDHGSSYLPSDMNAAYLWAQLLEADKINNDRLASWQTYYDAFEQLEQEGFVERPVIPEGCVHNAHMFYLKAKDLEERTALIDYFKKNDILAVFHYIPLHSAPAGVKFGRFHGEDVYTTAESDRLLRLPMYYGLKKNELNKIIDTVIKFYEG